MNRRRQSWRRWCIRTLTVVVGSAVLGFLLVQILLSTPWLRGKIAAKLSDRVGGLNVELADLNWTPWDGATLRGLRVEQPEALRELVSTPLLEVDEIHAWPDYRAAMKGEWTASEVSVVRPKFHVNAGMLISLAASSIPEALPPVVADEIVLRADDPVLGADDHIIYSAPLRQIPGLTFKAVSADEPESIVPMVDSVPADIHLDVSTLPVIPGDEIEKPVEPEPELPHQKVNEPTAAEPDEENGEAPKQTAPTAEEPARNSVRMRIEDGSFELTRIGQSVRLVVIEGIDLNLPLFAEKGQTRNSIALVEVFGQTIEENMEVKLMSKDGRFTFVLPDEEEKGSKLSGQFQIGAMRGFPIQSNLAFRLSSFGPVEVGESMVASAGDASGSVQVGGWLLSPGSLNGVAKLEANDVGGNFSGQALSFDSASGELLLSGGTIRSPDFRLIGDEASLLGNGWATPSDGAAVVRVVVPFSSVGMLNLGLTELVPESVFAFRPLKPDNRWISDVSLWRAEAGWMVGFGEGGSEMPIEDFISAE